VICFEHKRLYETRGLIPDEEYYIPFGLADIKRSGTDVTIVSTSRMLLESLKAAEHLQEEGINSEVIDLRTLVPWDKQTVLNSVQKTHHLVVVHETWKRAGWGAEIAATIQEEAFGYLESPILRVGAKNVHIPFSPELQDFVVPDYENVEDAVRKVVKR
jgi:acetoin:2,6-dichlorophenolindophenol oxidoreductase subunit beta